MISNIQNSFTPQRSLSAKPAAAEVGAAFPQDSVSLGSDNSLSAGDGVGTSLGWRTYGEYSSFNTATERNLGYKETNTHTRAGWHETIKGEDGTLYFHNEENTGTSSGSKRNGIVFRNTEEYISRFKNGATYIRD